MDDIVPLPELFDLNRREFPQVTSTLFAYLFGIINRATYYRLGGDLATCKRVLKVARNSGYVMRDCKLYAYAAWVARRRSVKAPTAASFNLHPRDAAFLRRLNLRGLRTNYVAFSVPTFERIIDTDLGSSDLRTYIGKYVSKKMKFLMNSYGVSRSDIEAHLLERALYAVYKQYPRYQSRLHLQNICKRTIHNAGLNLIQYHTRDKRQALQKTGPGFEAVNLPISELMHLPAPEVSPLKETLQALVQLEHRMSNEVRRFLVCAAGHHDENLSDWLGVRNDDAAEYMPYPKYLAKLRDYFGVTEHQTEQLFSKLRPHLIGV